MLTQDGDIYEILGIDRNADVKTIKKAYAALVKQYHPEEHPEEWQRIHDAYETAIELAADRKRRSSNISGQRRRSDNPEEERERELENIFKDVEKMAQEQREDEENARKERLELALKTVGHMTERKKLRLEEWKTFFALNGILPIISQREFLKGMGDCLTYKKIDDELYQLLMNQLNGIIDYLEEEGTGQQEMTRCIKTIEFVKGKVRAGNEYYHYTVEDWISDNKVYIIIVIFVVMYFVSKTMAATW